MNHGKRDWGAFALLVIDIQRDFWSKELQQAFPDFCSNVESLLALCREQGLDVIHLHAAFDADQSNWMARYRLAGRIPCTTGTGGEEVLSCALPLDSEPVLYKQTFDGFLQPQLRSLLEERGKRFVLAAGIETSVCVLTTALSATQLGFLAAVVDDCCADEPTRHEHVSTGYGFAFDTVGVNRILTEHDRWLGQLSRIGAVE